MKHNRFLIIWLLITPECHIFGPEPESKFFYCKINGKGWRPEKNSFSLGNNLKSEWNKKANNFNILAYNNEQYVWLLLKVDSNGLAKKRYVVTSSSNNSKAYYNFGNTSNPAIIDMISQSGFVELSLLEKGTISGTFEFITNNNEKTCKIKKGQSNNLLFTQF